MHISHFFLVSLVIFLNRVRTYRQSSSNPLMDGAQPSPLETWVGHMPMDGVPT